MFGKVDPRKPLSTRRNIIMLITVHVLLTSVIRMIVAGDMVGGQRNSAAGRLLALFRLPLSLFFGEAGYNGRAGGILQIANSSIVVLLVFLLIEGCRTMRSRPHSEQGGEPQ